MTDMEKIEIEIDIENMFKEVKEWSEEKKKEIRIEIGFTIAKSLSKREKKE